MEFGVFSEVGTLRKVLVCRSGLAQARLTPANCRELLFDDVLWVAQAKTDHYGFVNAMQDRGIEVFDTNDLLADILRTHEARNWILDRKLSPGTVDQELASQLRPWLDEMKPEELATRLIGGIVRGELPFVPAGLVSSCIGPCGFLLAPLPNALFTRDNCCWINDGVVLGSMYWPARRQETLLTAAIYQFHHRFNTQTRIWWGDPDVDHGGATLEGGDVMPLSRDVVVVGMGERTSPQAVTQLARSLFAREAATHVIAARLPPSRGAMHLDTVFTFCDRDLVTIFPKIVNGICCTSLRPGETRRARRACRIGALSGSCGTFDRPEKAMRYRNGWRRVGSRARAMGRRQQRHRAGAGRRCCLQPQRLHQYALAQGWRGSHHNSERRAGTRARGRPLHDLPARARRYLARTRSQRHHAI
ncbi:arginine deiminase [Caballeronia humi]|uniref:arginine deiminase n=1 Tax=Caballeronia humi TaxID=326474 RepID=A0A158IYI0_9BURK|nr:arginine deiminase [Caballeronia humi]